MAAMANEIIDRRRLRRKLTFWRIATLLVAAVAIIAASLRIFGDDVAGVTSDHIAKIRIEGTIVEDEELLERLRKIGESDDVQGVIIAVDSPGGTVTGGESIYEAIREIAEKKPVVTQVGTLAASAGYMIATASDHIVARQSSIVGSIGVLVQFPEFTGLMEKIGVGLEEIKSSPLKAEPSPFNKTTEEEREMIRAVIMDSYNWFVDLVAERRPLDRTQVLAVADGSIFTGRQAVKKKLVDELGGEEISRNWLESKGIETELDIIEWKKKRDVAFFGPVEVSSPLGRLLGLSEGDQDLLERTGLERIFLDGLVSVWHPK